MGIGDKINMGLLIINSLVFVIMFITLIFQGKSIKQNQRSLEVSNKSVNSSILGLKLHYISILLEHKQNELSQLDSKASIEEQKYINSLKKDIQSLSNRLNDLEKEMEDK